MPPSANRKIRSPLSVLKGSVIPSPRKLRVVKRPEKLVFADEDDVQTKSPGFFHWDDERTLVADLMHTGLDEETEDDKICSLIHSLEPAFSLKSQELLADLADTLVPVVQRVKSAHKVLDTDVDETFRRGLAEFESSCKSFETAILTQDDGLNSSRKHSQTRLADLFQQLDQAFQARDQLWNEFERFLDAQYASALSMFEQLPAEIEVIITNAEKQKKALIASDKNGPEKFLKEMLSKLA